VEYDLVIWLVVCSPCTIPAGCKYLIEPGVGAAGEETIELSSCVSQSYCFGREHNLLLQGGGDMGPHSWEPSLNPS